MVDISSTRFIKISQKSRIWCILEFFTKRKLSCLRSHSPDSLRRQIFLYVIWGVVFDEVTGVGEGNDGIGDVLTEDHYDVPRVSDQAAQH